MKITLNLKNKLLISHLAGWTIAQYVFVPLGISGDQDNFLYSFSANPYSSNGLTSLFYRLPGVILPSHLPTLLITIASAYTIYRATMFFYPTIDKFLFWSVNLLPNFLIWSGIASKEAIFIPFAICVCAVSARIVLSPYKILHLTQTIPLLAIFTIMFILRPQFTIAYAFLFFGSLLWRCSKGSLSHFLRYNRYSKSLVLLLSVILVFFIPLTTWLILQSMPEYTSTLMSVSQGYFLSEAANTNRYDIEWVTAGDYLRNMSWGIPQSIIGFNFTEAITKWQYFFSFLEGLFSFYLLFMCAYSPFRKLIHMHKALYVFIFIPSLVSVILILYPFGIFNPGSAIRYKQCITPLLYFYPLYLSSVITMQKKS